MYRRELYWLTGTTIVALFLNFLIFGFEVFNTDAAIDLNVHDSYFVLPNTYFVLIISAFLFFAIYVVRSFRNKFKNKVSNVILLIATIVFIFFVDQMKALVDLIVQSTMSRTVYPPLSATETEIKVEYDNKFTHLSYSIFIFQLVLLVLLAYFGVRTGRNYTQKD